MWIDAEADTGGESPCWAHLLDEDGRLIASARDAEISVRFADDAPGAADAFPVLVDRLRSRGLKEEHVNSDMPQDQA